MKNEFSEIVEVEKVRKKFEEVADKYLKSWTDVFTQTYCGEEFKLLDSYVNFNTCEACIEYTYMGVRTEAIFQLQKYDEESGRMDWISVCISVSRTLDYITTFDDDYDEDEEEDEVE